MIVTNLLFIYFICFICFLRINVIFVVLLYILHDVCGCTSLLSALISFVSWCNCWCFLLLLRAHLTLTTRMTTPGNIRRPAPLCSDAINNSIVSPRNDRVGYFIFLTFYVNF